VNDDAPHESDRPVIITGDLVRVITLHRPAQANAITREVQRGLLDALDAIVSADDARAIVLTGEGKAFSAGGDFSLIRAIQRDLDARRETLQLARELFLRFTSLELPVIAAVNGPAVGAGCTLALLCDVMFMADNAFLSEPRVSIGLVPGDGAATLWPHVAGLAAARAYLLSGERVSARDAHSIGMAHRVVPADELLSAALRYASRLSSYAPTAVRATKRLLGLNSSATIAHLQLAIGEEFRSIDDVDLSPEGVTQ
jgi:enoyl-CoA hydratase